MTRARGQTRRFFLWGVSIRNSLRSNKKFWSGYYTEVSVERTHSHFKKSSLDRLSHFLLLQVSCVSSCTIHLAILELVVDAVYHVASAAVPVLLLMNTRKETRNRDTAGSQPAVLAQTTYVDIFFLKGVFHANVSTAAPEFLTRSEISG